MDQTMTPRVTCEAGLEDGMLRGTFALPEHSSAARFIANLAKASGTRTDFDDGQKMEPHFDGGTDGGSKPFLTVVVRTQGKRREELMDALLCLASQCDDDFELVLIGHKVSEENVAVLGELVAQCPASLRSRLRFYLIDHGGRTAPLQAGASLARGSYVSFFDDDDLLMDTWVARFKELAKGHEGQILFQYAVSQKWEATSTSRSEASRELRACDGFNATYCRDFDAASQLTTNTCPLMSLAFPIFLFRDLGMRFDDTLTTTEDWDFLMRAYSVCGVVSSGEPTAIYRLWTNTETSHVLHGEREWAANYERIVSRLNERPFLLAPGGVEDVRSKEIGVISSKISLARTSLLALYADCVNTEQTVDDLFGKRTGRKPSPEVPFASACPGDGEWDVTFELPDAPSVSELVFSPVHHGFIVLGEFSMRVTGSDGSVFEYDFAQCAHNGYQVDCNHIVYLKDNPFVSLKLPQETKVMEVDYKFVLMPRVPDYYIDQITLGNAGLVVGRARRWLGRKIRGHA